MLSPKHVPHFSLQTFLSIYLFSYSRSLQKTGHIHFHGKSVILISFTPTSSIWSPGNISKLGPTAPRPHFSPCYSTRSSISLLSWLQGQQRNGTVEEMASLNHQAQLWAFPRAGRVPLGHRLRAHQAQSWCKSSNSRTRTAVNSDTTLNVSEHHRARSSSSSFAQR